MFQSGIWTEFAQFVRFVRFARFRSEKKFRTFRDSLRKNCNLIPTKIMSKMAGTKRARENVDTKASKKVKPSKEGPKKHKFESVDAAGEEEDFVAFDDGLEEPVSEAKAAFTKKPTVDYDSHRSGGPNKQESFLSGTSTFLLRFFRSKFLY
jgi:hypothetical protein